MHITNPELLPPRTSRSRSYELITRLVVSAILFDMGYELIPVTIACRTAILFGILYLAFQAWPFIFGINHGFDVQTTGLAFIGIGIGMVIGCALNVTLTM